MSTRGVIIVNVFLNCFVWQDYSSASRLAELMPNPKAGMVRVLAWPGKLHRPRVSDSSQARGHNSKLEKARIQWEVRDSGEEEGLEAAKMAKRD